MTSSIAKLRETLGIDEVSEIVRHRRAARNRAQKIRRSRFKADYPGMPHYDRALLEYALEWLDRRRVASWECELREVVHYLRQDAGAALGRELADQVQDRGVAKILRAVGVQTWRANDGLMVRGVRPK